MTDPFEAQFYQDLAREDDLGLVVKAHLHIEHQLLEFISLHLPYKERCDWSRIGYAAKVDLALALGLPDTLRKPLVAIGTLRNEFAHNLSYSQASVDAVALYNGLPALLHSGVKESYRLVKGVDLKPRKVSNRDLLVILLINIRQAVRAAVEHKSA